MNKNRSSVEVRSTVNTVDFERVMNLFSSSFTESFLKVVESQFGMGIQSNVIEEVKPIESDMKDKVFGSDERKGTVTLPQLTKYLSRVIESEKKI
jgi:hypothetical protein